MDEQEQKSTLKVMDRRRVDERGEDRADSEQQNNANRNSAQDVSLGSAAEVKSAISSNDQVQVREDTEPVNFSSFIMSLATQALMQLGAIKPPEGVDLAVDAAAARQTIDIISMLRDKTNGNLGSEEQHLMDEIVNSLRIQFVQKAKK